jgi:light-regulated signal transduction histidine kinase (bacteriophytochrome)
MTAAPHTGHTPAYAPADLTNCEDEPIHIPGAIQPHGALLAVDPATFEVVVASANTADLLGSDTGTTLGRSLGEVIGAGLTTDIRRRWSEQAFNEPMIVRLPDTTGGALAGAEVDITLHRSGERLVVEVESLGRPRSVLLSYQSARAAMARISARTTVLDLAEQLAREVGELTGFDRVMVYRFDQDWNGEVIAEERRPDLNAFLGLHYPAADIPAQARRLYTVNWTRLIADVDYAPVPLEPVLDPATGAPLDLSFSTLRSVSPIHLEYLQNMGVTASMSISLVIDGELWGLIACHHYSGPHRPSQDARAAAEFLGQVASQQIAERTRSDDRERALHRASTLGRIIGRAAATNAVLDAIMTDPEMLTLMDATGVALSYDGALRTLGEVPDRRVVDLVAMRLLDTEDGSTGASDRICDLDPTLSDCANLPPGGMVVGTLPDRYIVWFRPEIEQTVDWGGDPHNKEIAAAEDGSVRLSPRKSFEKWRETVRGRSRAWDEDDLAAARDLRDRINGLLLKGSRDQIEVAESLQRSVLANVAPTLDGLDVAVRYTSAASYQLGGDWWDCLVLDRQRVAFVIGDVAGHGVSAVAAMTQVRAALRAYLFASNDLGHSLDQLDRFMSALLGDQIASAQIAVIDRATRVIEVASAGHPAPLLLPPDPAIPLTPVARPVLGLGSGEAVVTAVEVPAGTTLLMFTDGLVERRGVDLFESLDNLAVVAGSGPEAGHLESWLDQLLTGLPEPGDDDRTVVAITVQ